MLEVGIFGVDIFQPAHFTCGTLQAVVVVGDRGESVGMEQVLMAAHGIVERRQYGFVVDSSVIGKHVDNHAHAVFAGTVAHSLESVAVTDFIVAYLPVGGLVIVVPFAFDAVAFPAEERHASVFTDIACLHWRCLHEIIARFSY